jgi:hypothetical protein
MNQMAGKSTKILQTSDLEDFGTVSNSKARCREEGIRTIKLKDCVSDI